ncbi:MAG: hypothetical protein HY840_12530 [Bacteroidetes bacterium]|nr:hypothetical protein [Bacteroidota bacterium]
METRQDIYKNYFTSKDAIETISISDLRNKEFLNENLSEEELQAIRNFDRFRLRELNKLKTDFDFNARFCELQIMSNIADYKEFLKEEYFFSELL